MTEDEYLERYAQRIMRQAGWSEGEARRYTQSAEPYETLSEGFEDDPEGAADEEMSYWSD